MPRKAGLRPAGARVRRRVESQSPPAAWSPLAAEGSGADPSDEQLIEGIRSASRPHFEIVYRRYFDRSYACAYERLRSHADAEENVQESFIPAYASSDGYRGRASLLAWLYGIASNTINSHLRRTALRRDELARLPSESLAPSPPLAVSRPEPPPKLRCRSDQRSERSSDAVRSSLHRVEHARLEAGASVDSAETR